MPAYTERGLREIDSGLSEARDLLRRRRQDLTLKLSVIQSEITELSKIEGAIDGAVDVLRSEAARRKEAAP